MDKEEERLSKTLNKRGTANTSAAASVGNDLFEQKRRDMLSKYQTTGKAKDFTLSSVQTEEDKQYEKFREQEERQRRLEQERLEQENRRNRAVPEPQKQSHHYEPQYQPPVHHSPPQTRAVPQNPVPVPVPQETAPQFVETATEKSLGFCPGCGKSVGENHVRALDKLWHGGCFACLQCRKDISEEEFVVSPKGLPICKSCNENLAPTCPRCEKPVTGRKLDVMDKIWHPDCFVCFKCGAPLDDYMEKAGKPFCFQRCRGR